MGENSKDKGVLTGTLSKKAADTGDLYGTDSSSQYGGTDPAAVYGSGTQDLYGAPAPAASVQYASMSDYGTPPTVAAPVKPPQNILPTVPAAPPREDASVDDILLVPTRIAAADKKIEVVAPVTGVIEVQRGDTVFSISQRYSVPVRDLVSENYLSPPYNITPGQKLRIPSARYHTVVAGDTLYSVSRAYSVDLNSLVLANDLKEPYSVSVGQRLRLPASVTAQPAMPIPVVAATPTAPTLTPAATPPVQTPTAAPPAAPPPRPRTAPDVEVKPKSSSTTASGTVTKLPTAGARTSTKFSWPVQGKIISDFGAKKNGLYNDGINISAPAGTVVRAAENGVVAYSGNELKGMGNLIIIQHSDGWMTVYAHLDTMTVKRGAKVSVGEKIGTIGTTGKVAEPQLHFEIRKGTRAYNPRTQLK
ncbi:MAG: LysM peptidoglycan-binding domain-containing M23 family metallopeptidase [Alphaproteobacteria bacterium]|nr:LysM peptidoglycan-binding domain-containing M23 family metallopeptidase [Alphaproteobacteria bacterium]